MQVVIRDGRPTGALVPDYNELGPGLLDEYAASRPL